MYLVGSCLSHQWPWYWWIQRRMLFGQTRFRTRQKKKLQGAPNCWGTQSEREAQLECLVPFGPRPVHRTDTTELLSTMRRASSVQINSRPFWQQAAETLLAVCPALGTGEAIDALLSFSRANYAEGNIISVLLKRICEITDIASLDVAKLLRLLSARGVQSFPDRSFITAVYDALVKQFHTLDEHQVALSLRSVSFGRGTNFRPMLAKERGRGVWGGLLIKRFFGVDGFVKLEDGHNTDGWFWWHPVGCPFGCQVVLVLRIVQHIRWCAIASESVPIDDATFLRTLCNEIHRRLESLDVSDVIILTKALGATRRAPSRLTESLFAFLCRNFPDIPLVERPLLCEALTVTEPTFPSHLRDGFSLRASDPRTEFRVTEASVSYQNEETGTEQELAFPSGYEPKGGTVSWEPSPHRSGNSLDACYESKNESFLRGMEGQLTSFQKGPCHLFVYRCANTVLKRPRLFSAGAVFQVYTCCRRLGTPLCNVDLRRLRNLLDEKLNNTTDIEEKLRLLGLAEKHEEFTLILKACVPFDMEPASITEAGVEIFLRVFSCALRLKHREGIVACLQTLRPFVLYLKLDVDASSEPQNALLWRRALLVVSSALNQEDPDTLHRRGDEIGCPLTYYTMLERLGLRKSDLRLARQIAEILRKTPTQALAFSCLNDGHAAGSHDWFKELLGRLSCGEHASGRNSEWIPALVYSISRSLTGNAAQELTNILPSSILGHAHQSPAAALEWVTALCMHGFPVIAAWKTRKHQESSYPAAALPSLTLATLLQGLLNCAQGVRNELKAFDGVVLELSDAERRSEEERVEGIHTEKLNRSPVSVLATTAGIATDLLLSRWESAHSLTVSAARELALRRKRYGLRGTPAEGVEAWQLVRALQCAVAFRLPRDPLLIDCVCVCAKSLARTEELLLLLRVMAVVGNLSPRNTEALSAAVDRRQAGLLESPVLSQKLEHYCEVLGLSSIDVTSLALLPASSGDAVLGSEGIPETYRKEAVATRKKA